MRRASIKISILVLIAACAVFLQFRSLPAQRVRQARSLASTGRIDQAIRVYESVLRKQSVVHSPNKDLVVYARLRLAELFDKKGMRSRAMQEYYRCVIAVPEARRQTMLRPQTPDERRDFAMTILEERPGKQALEYLESLNDFGADWGVYREIAGTVSMDPDMYYYALGSAYIERQLFEEARIYLTSRILRYVHPLSVLRYCFGKYAGADSDLIIEKVWGRGIYVTLENFEHGAYPVLSHWVSRSPPIRFAQGFEINGFRGVSEYLDTDYSVSHGYDLWVVLANVLLGETGCDVGVRLYCSSDSISLRANVIYPAENRSVLLNGGSVKRIDDGWFEYSIGSLRKLARDAACSNSWKTDRMYLDKIVIDTMGRSGRIVIDEIELFVYAQ